MFWTPAFAGVTTKETFYEFINILLLLEKRNLITAEERDKHLSDLDRLCRQITSFIKSLE